LSGICSAKERGKLRRIAALAVVVGLLVSLAGCSAGAPSGACVAPLKSGDASSIVTATGAFGAKTTAAFPTPLVTKGVEVSTISQGAGKTIYPGQMVDFQATVLNAKTGEAIFATSFDKNNAARVKAANGVGIGPALVCATVGSRLATTITVRQFAGKNGVDASYGLSLTDTLVFVVDIVASYLGRADGVDQLPQAGFPSVVLAPNGQPGLTIPNTAAPKDLMIEVLKRGDGPRVKKNDIVVTNYTAVIWSTQKVLSTNWDQVANNFQAKKLDATDGSGVVDGMAKAMIGQTVGSQVIVIVPPKYGYPSSSLPTGLTAGSTLIFVFDVLGIAK
jgi:FKBP-type peptidyl-prolyl cis-trans isomerase